MKEAKTLQCKRQEFALNTKGKKKKKKKKIKLLEC